VQEIMTNKSTVAAKARLQIQQVWKHVQSAAIKEINFFLIGLSRLNSSGFFILPVTPKK
jgi:hypothetical protein